MNQSEFQRALKKFEQGKARKARAELAALERPKAVAPALPFVERPVEVVKAPKPEYKAKPLLEMTVTFDGPVPMKFTIDYSGTLMGGQMTEAGLKPIVKKALSVMGRVI